MSEKKRWLCIGDTHGCYLEFLDILVQANFDPETDVVVSVGDLCDRGPFNFAILNWFFLGKHKGYAEVVMGNHDWKLLRWLKGNKVKVSKGFQKTIDEIERMCDAKDKAALYYFLSTFPTTYETKHFIAVHGAYKDPATLESENEFFNTAIRGETTGEKDPEGFPVRLDEWKKNYKGTKDIVHGHIVCGPVAGGSMAGSKCPDQFKTENGAIISDIDGGCVFGGELILLEYPGRKVYRQQAKEVYYVRKPGLVEV